MFDPEPEQLLWRYQARNESVVIKSQTSDVHDDTEHRVVIEVERVCFPAERIRVYTRQMHTGAGQIGELLTVVFVSYETWSLSASRLALEHVDRSCGPCQRRG
jgi:hypothetical protein